MILRFNYVKTFLTLSLKKLIRPHFIRHILFLNLTCNLLGVEIH
jgi:hypothetical protein